MAGTVTYFCYDLINNQLLAVLPFTNVSFGLRFNTPGSFSASLDLADPVISDLNSILATTTGRTMLVVDVDGVIVATYIIWTRSFDKASRILTIGGNEVWSYWAHRIQHNDYTEPPAAGPYWTSNPANAHNIAAQILYDAQQLYNSAFPEPYTPIIINVTEAPSSPIVASLPLSQLQSIDSMVKTLSNGGYLTAFDFTMSAGWWPDQGGYPLHTIQLWYPRCGAVGSPESEVITIGGQETAYTWPEDSTAQAWIIFGSGGSGGALQAWEADDVPLLIGWPVLEATSSYAEIQTHDALLAATLSDIANQEWPIVTPSVTIPMFGLDSQGNKVGPSVLDIEVGDDVIIEPDEFFPGGADISYLRIIGIDCQPNDSGLSTMTLTFNPPPSLAPAPQPVTGSDIAPVPSSLIGTMTTLQGVNVGYIPTFTTHAPGNLVVLVFDMTLTTTVYGLDGEYLGISNIVGGNCYLWARVGVMTVVPPGGSTLHRMEMWMGTVNAIGNGPIQLDSTGYNFAGNQVNVAVQELSGTTQGGRWSPDHYGSEEG